MKKRQLVKGGHVLVGGIRLAVTLLVATTGGMLGKKYKLPAGFLTGAIIAVVVCNLASSQMYFPGELRPYVQIASGALVGSRIKRKDLQGMGQLIAPGIILIIGMLTMNVLFGLLLYYFTTLDAFTAFYGAAPGGMQDMGLIAQDFGADPVIVSVIQLVRLVFILTSFPFFYRKVNQHTKNGPENECYENSTPQKVQLDITISKKEKRIRLMLTVALATLGGVVFKAIGVPGGALTGAMLLVITLGILTEKSYFPSNLKGIIQIFAGAYIGSQVQPSSLTTMKELLVPLFLLCIGIMIVTYVVAFIMSKVSKLDMVSCMLMSTPGGLSEMTLLADEFGCNVPKVVVIHTLRVMVVISLFPTILEKIVTLIL